MPGAPPSSDNTALLDGGHKACLHGYGLERDKFPTNPAAVVRRLGDDVSCTVAVAAPSRNTLEVRSHPGISWGGSIQRAVHAFLPVIGFTSDSFEFYVHQLSFVGIYGVVLMPTIRLPERVSMLTVPGGRLHRHCSWFCLPLAPTWEG